ncbi:hypothetical protein [Halanaerobium hydrogeniformans]|uniref:Uncharacterized protein n=1 Tax=Halanaerobium hydrogeniformans TaxID=656519 RepID=E4RLC5_HALHG|nr:hypothetical protein [Halanaerobium hydrogeniformans]ADQ14839.1 hypothetical protein Halsa_1412 [Halanaerobium hydrogeniformans]
MKKYIMAKLTSFRLDNKGYIIYLNLVLISLIALFIPLLMQQQYLNHQISSQRVYSSQNRAAVEAGVEYISYQLAAGVELPLAEELYLDEDLKINIRGEEGEEYYYFYSEAANKNNKYLVEITVDKDNLSIINKKISRGD